MGRIIYVLLVGIFILAGCGGNKNTGIIMLSNISFTADISEGKREYIAKCNVDSHKNLSLKIVSPESLNGLVFDFEGDKCNVSLDGIKIENALYQSDAFMLSKISRILRTIDKTSFESDKRNGKISGKSGEEEYKLTVSPGGLPLSMEMPDSNLKLTFKNVVVDK